MNKRSASDTELAIECITYLGYLDKQVIQWKKYILTNFYDLLLFQARYQDAVVNLRNLLGDSSVLNEIQDPQSLKSLVVLCNKYACRLFKESKNNLLQFLKILALKANSLKGSSSLSKGSSSWTQGYLTKTRSFGGWNWASIIIFLFMPTSIWIWPNAASNSIQ